jgi:hypothetical protein
MAQISGESRPAHHDSQEGLKLDVENLPIGTRLFLLTIGGERGTLVLATKE